MNSANDKYGSSLDRTLGAGKPVDPVTRPFDPPRPGPGPARPAAANPDAAAGQPLSPEAAAHDLLPREEAPEPSPEASRIDADKALAELEAELFAAAKQVDGDASIAHLEAGEEPRAAEHADHAPLELTDRPAET